jgi:uncharacterized protein (AIM24 family)
VPEPPTFGPPCSRWVPIGPGRVTGAGGSSPSWPEAEAVKAQVKGTTLPILEVQLDPGEAVVSDHGELAWMSPTIQMTQKTSTGGKGGLMAGLKRVAGGAGIFLTEYLAAGGAGAVTFATHLPGTILPVEIAPDRAMIVHRSGWICGTPGISPTVAFQQNFGGAIFGGEGFILQRL